MRKNSKSHKNSKPAVSFKAAVFLKERINCRNVYKKRKNGKVKLETHVSGPFFPDKTLSNKEARIKLRNEIYESMVSLSKLNEIEVVKYLEKEKANND